MSRRSSRKSPGRKNRVILNVEALEDRAVPSTNTISGYVYFDANNNGVFDPGEKPIANSQIVLINNTNGQIAGTTTTAADGSYSFTTDDTIQGPEQYTTAQTITLGPTLTNFQDTGALPQFNSSLGTLDKVVITESGTILSTIQAENTSPDADTIDGTVSGNFSLSAPGVSNDSLSVTGQTNTFSAAGNPNDDHSFTGASSVTWSDVSATSATPNTITITDPTALADYVGNGTVAVTETADATSNAKDTTGNITTNIVSDGEATLTVTYYYHTAGSIQTNTSYTVEQPNVPNGYVPGLNSKNGTILPYNPTPPEEITNIIVTPQNPVAPNNNFGELKTTSISGVAYVQSTANQLYTPGTTPPLGGVTMTLTGGSLATPLTTVTAGNGTYSFNNLQPGNYTVTQTQPANYQPGTIAAGTDGGMVSPETISQITLNPGDSATGYNFGELDSTSISGYVYYEPNAPQQTLYENSASTPGIAGVTVTLTGSNGSTQTTTTGQDGSYSFTALTPGATYTVAITHPAGYLVGTDTAGSAGGQVNNPSEQISQIVLPGATSATGYNFGEVLPTSIAGVAYVQTTPNQTYQPGTTPPLAGVTMTLTGGNLATPLTTTTANNGSYSFTNLAPGTYTVTQTQPAAYEPGTITAGSQGGTVGSETISQVTLLSSDNGTGYNFGELNQPSIAGYVYYEPNAPTQVLYQSEAATPGIAGVTVTLSGSDGSTKTTTTAADGSYSFTGLSNTVTYSIAIAHPSGYLVGTDTAGSAGGTVNNPSEKITAISMTGGSVATGYDFGEIQPASLSGNVYVDTPNAGQIEPGDPPISGDTITLTGFNDQGPVNLTTTTAANGTYSFTNLRPGTYGITQTQPAGYTPGATTVGSQGGSETTGSITSIALDPNVNGANNNFGELQPITPTPPNPGPQNIPGWGTLPIVSKTQLLGLGTNNLPPALLADMALVVGTQMTLTGQQPSAAAVMAGVQTINSSGAAAFISSVWNSEAHLASEVQNAYQTAFGSAPTSAQLSAGILQLESGVSSTALLQGLLTSQEFQNLHPTSTALATALYQAVLNETPGSVASQAMVQSLGTQTLSTVVQNLLSSTAALENEIDDAYLLVYRRDPTATEMQIWLPQLQAGTLTADQLTQQLLESQEFAALAVANVS